MTDYESGDLTGAAYLAAESPEPGPSMSDVACCRSCFDGGRCRCDEAAAKRRREAS